MSNPENFVARWSRLKQETTKEKDTAELPLPSDDAGADGAGQKPQDAPAKASSPPHFDPSSLPSVETITAESDIRGFLQAGVPSELTTAALRRVWVADPAIRNFIGIAENQWDFTDPTAMPGFGPLEATDDVRELVAQAMGKLGRVIEPEQEVAGDSGSGSASISPVASENSHTCDPPQNLDIPEQNPSKPLIAIPVEPHNSEVSAAPQHATATAERGSGPNRRPHGRALPQ